MLLLSTTPPGRGINMREGTQLSLFRNEDFIPEVNRIMVKAIDGEQRLLDSTKITSLTKVEQVDGGELWYVTSHLGKHYASSFPITEESANRLFLLGVKLY